MRIVDPNSGRAFCKKRRTRFDEPNEPRELTFSCYRHFPFLSRDRTREWLCESISDARRETGVEIWAYVIMPDHVHILVNSGTRIGQVSEFLKAAKEPVARKAIAQLKSQNSNWLHRITAREGKRTRHRFWQPGGRYDRNVQALHTLRTMIDYIHANPVRRGLVERAEDWEWSSARWFAGHSVARIAIDRSVFDVLGMT